MFDAHAFGCAALLAAFAAVGCGSSDAPPPASTGQPEGAADAGNCGKFMVEPYSAGMTFKGPGGFVIALMDSNPAPPAEGDNTWTLDIKDPNGQEVTDATITTYQLMVVHGHGGAKTIVVTPLGGGSYKAAPVNFTMAGYWENFFTVTSGGLTDKVDINVCIP
jgi:hypothetical protein